MLALLAAPSAAGAQGVDQTCELSLTRTDPATVNFAYPDEGAVYYLANYQAVPGTRIRISGLYPHSRYISFNVYDNLQRPLDALADVQIAPDPGSSNPFVLGAGRTVSRRSYTAFIDFGPVPSGRAPNTLYTGTGQNGAPNFQGTFIYRIYVSDRGRDLTGGVGIPTVTLEQANGSPEPPSACAGFQKPPVPGVNDQVAASNGLPVAPASLPGENPPLWKKFFNLPNALADEYLDNPYADRFRPTYDQTPVDRLGGNGAFLSNIHNAYLFTPTNRAYGQVLVTRLRAPTFPDTRPGPAVMPGGQVRYFSMCQNESVSQRFIACRTDDQSVVRDGFITYLVSTPAQRPANATAACGITWLPWGPSQEGVLIYRHMLADPSFAQSIQLAQPGQEAKTMGDYFPVSRYYADKAAFESTGCAQGGGATRTEPFAGRFSCAKPTGRLAGVNLGPVRLGMTRARVRSRFARYSLRGRRYMDFFCPARRGIRVGYPSPALLRSLSHSERRRVQGRAVLVLTASHHYALRGVRPGTRLARVTRRLRVGEEFHIGLNRWYLAANGSSRGVMKVRHGVIEEIGIANARLTRTRRAARRFLARFS